MDWIIRHTQQGKQVKSAGMNSCLPGGTISGGLPTHQQVTSAEFQKQLMWGKQASDSL